MADPVTLKFPITFTGPISDNLTYEPPHPCPETWSEKVFGFDLCGQTTSAPDNHDPQPPKDGSYDQKA